MKGELVESVAKKIASEVIGSNGTEKDAWRITEEVLTIHRFSKQEELKIKSIVKNELLKHGIKTE